MTTLENILRDGYAAVILKRGSEARAMNQARTAFEEDASLKAAAETELKRLQAMGSNLDKRCMISSTHRDFLKSVLL